MRDSDQFDALLNRVEKCIAVRDNACDPWAQNFWEKLAYQLSARYRGSEKDPHGKIIIKLD
jgi:hypothetical protein